MLSKPSSGISRPSVGLLVEDEEAEYSAFIAQQMADAAKLAEQPEAVVDIPAN